MNKINAAGSFHVRLARSIESLDICFTYLQQDEQNKVTGNVQYENHGTMHGTVEGSVIDTEIVLNVIWQNGRPAQFRWKVDDSGYMINGSGVGISIDDKTVYAIWSGHNFRR